VNDPAAGTYGLRRRLIAVAPWAAGLVVLGLVALVQGLTPWAIGSGSAWSVAVGYVECGEVSLGDLLHNSCVLAGGDLGLPIGNGWPIVAAGSVLGRFGGLSGPWALSVVYLVLAALAVAGTVLLTRRMGVPWGWGLVAAFAFLTGPSVLGMAGFGSTFFGMALLPAAIWAITELAGALTPRRLLASVGAAAGLIAVNVTLLLLDGYGFVMAQVAVGLLLVARAGGRSAREHRFRAIVFWGIMTGAAYAIYHVTFADAGGSATSPIDLFRAMGADVVSLVVPSTSIWWGSGTYPAVLWGDGTNSTSNYLGVVAVLLAVAGGVLAWRRDRRQAIWVVIAIVALAMALGPSLKIDAVRGPLAVPVTPESYNMPASDATLTLPTQWLYEHVPGLDLMRATYRWLVLTRLALVVLGALALASLARRGARGVVAAVLVAVLGLVELAPNLPNRFSAMAETARDYRQFDAEVVRPLDAATPDWSRVLFLPNAAGGNDFLAVRIAAGAHLWTYNAGGDKSLVVARAGWPQVIRTALDQEVGTDTTAEVEDVLKSKLVDAVVVPFFDLRWSATAWPTYEQFTQPGEDLAAQAEADPELSVEMFERFAIVRLASSASG
jgi:hypothetical protein